MSSNLTSKCNLMPKSNATASFPIDPYWENIPETLFLNMIIGMVLYSIFDLFVRIAKRKQEHNNENAANEKFGWDQPSMFTLIYGYRDPEKWYVLPRYEFLKPDRRRHKHELKNSRLLVPPKLPAANPLGLFTFERAARARKSLPEGHHEKINQSDAAPSDQQKNKQESDSNPSSPDQQQAATTKSTLAPLESGYFYPTVLSDSQLQGTRLTRYLNRLFSYFFRTTDADMIYAKGVDAYEYLLFQRHLILILFLVSLLCCCVILPINWFAGTRHLDGEGKQFSSSFQRTTIKNLSESTRILWVHIACSVGIMFLSIYCLNSYRQSITTRESTELAHKTLLIGNIPKEQRHRERLLQIFAKYFPKCQIEAIQFVYDVSELEPLQQNLDIVLVARDYCQAYKRKHQASLMVKQSEVNEAHECCGMCRVCSYCFLCCFRWPREAPEPGEQFYKREELRFRDKCASLCRQIVEKPHDFAFVTFRNHRQARTMLSELTKLKNDALNDRLSRLLNLSHDSVTLGPQASSPQSSVVSSSDAAADSKAQLQASKVSLTLGELPTSNQATKSITNNTNSLDKTKDGTENSKLDEWDPVKNPQIRSIRSPILKRLKRGEPKSDVAGSQPSIKSAASQLLKKSLQKQAQQQKSLRSGTNSSASIDSAAPESSLDNKNNNIRIQMLQKEDLGAALSSKSKLDAISRSPLAWSVRYAPHPDNVQYKDLLRQHTISRYTIFAMHLLMVVIFIFFTTPTVVMSVLDKAISLRPNAENTSAFENVLLSYGSTLLQILSTSLLPQTITLISKQIPHEDTAKKSHSIMWKTYLFLVLMVIVMPSVGMSSAQAFVSADIDPSCLFPADNGSYFINYVISSIFISNIMELLKPVEVLTYYFLVLTSRSQADFEGARQSLSSEFSISDQHTAVLLMFSVVMTYSISCPLIAPAGLIYLIIKNRVDHYHLYNTHFPKKVGVQLQSTIVIFVKSAILLMLFQTMISISIHTGTSYFSLTAQVVFWSSMAVFLLTCFYNCTSRSSSSSSSGRALSSATTPLARELRETKKREYCACFYLPLTLDKLLRGDAIPPDCISKRID